MAVTIRNIPVFEALIGEDGGMRRISLVDEPAVMSDFLAFAEDKPLQTYRISDEEQRRVLGVVMRADFPIYRRDDDFGEYYIIYRADTIREMAQRYLAESRQNLVDLMHDGEDVDGFEMVQFFIKGNGICPAGFEHIADGSLFAEFKAVDDDIWAAVKDGTYRGFSLEGYFDLTPVPDSQQANIEGIVKSLNGQFHKNSKKMKVKQFFKDLADALRKVELGSISTDKGLISWDGDDDLQVGDTVYSEDENGTRVAAEDGEYRTDEEVITVADGKVASIEEREARADDNEDTEDVDPQNFGRVTTDNGTLIWEGEEDLKAGDEVYVEDEEGNRSAAADGTYTTEDGKVITVVDGRVASIEDESAEVASLRRFRRKVEQMAATYDEIYRHIFDAIREIRGGGFFYVCEAGNDYAVIDAWDDVTFEDRFFRYPLSTDVESGEVTVTGEAVEVKKMFVPLDFESPFESDTREEVADLRRQIAEFKRRPAAAPAHEAFTTAAVAGKTGIKKLDRLAEIMRAGE